MSCFPKRPARHGAFSARTAAAILALAVVAVAILTATGCSVARSRNLAENGESVAEPPAHPAFNLSEDQLMQLVEGLPRSITSRIAERPRRFLELLDPVLDLPGEFTILVDKQHPLPVDYEPDHLVSLHDYRGRIGYAAADRMVLNTIVDDLLAMAEAAREDVVDLLVQSAYRSWGYQQALYNNYVARHGEEAAARFSAQPGHSQHQLGTAVDFAPIGHRFSGTEDDRWLREHAWRFGFSLSYPDGYEEITGYLFEPWHYRYIGRPATLLERVFFDGVQQYMLEFVHRYGDQFRAARLE